MSVEDRHKSLAEKMLKLKFDYITFVCPRCKCKFHVNSFEALILMVQLLRWFEDVYVPFLAKTMVELGVKTLDEIKKDIEEVIKQEGNGKFAERVLKKIEALLKAGNVQLTLDKWLTGSKGDDACGAGDGGCSSEAQVSR